MPLNDVDEYKCIGILLDCTVNVFANSGNIFIKYKSLNGIVYYLYCKLDRRVVTGGY